MRDFLKRESEGFTDEAVRLLVDAFDEAWAIARVSEGVNERNREAKRLALARRLVDLAGHGDYDHHSLRDAALASLGIKRAAAPAKPRTQSREALVL